MFTDSTNSMNMPWVHSPVFNSILNNLEISEEQRELAEKFNKDGYVVVDLGLSDQEIYLAYSSNQQTSDTDELDEHAISSRIQEEDRSSGCREGFSSSSSTEG